MCDEMSEKSFLDTVEHHDIEIVMNNGLYRHLKFRKKNTVNMWFDILTWPGTLCINGDMGCYVFSRLPDMFEFFRRGDKDAMINPSYWAEKVISVCKCSPVKEYSAEKFERIVREHLDDIEASDELREAVNDDILQDGVCYEESCARESVNNFTWEGEYIFQDFWEHDLKEFTYHYLWNCHAIVWGISRYDQLTGLVKNG